MSVFSAFDICATGMTAQRTRLDIISQNIANVNTTRDGDGNPYMRKSVIFEEKSYVSFDDALINATGRVGKGVKVAKIFEDMKQRAVLYMTLHILMLTKKDMYFYS